MIKIVKKIYIYFETVFNFMKKIKFINLLSFILILLASIILIYIFYKSNVHEGNMQSYYIKYYFLSGLFLFLSIFIFFLTTSLNLNY